MNRVGPFRFEQPGNPGAFCDPQAFVNIFVATQSTNNGKIGTDPIADGFQDLQCKSCPARDITAVFVFPVVGKRRQEGADQITMGHMQLDTIGPDLFDPFGGGSISFHKRFDFIDTELMRRFHGWQGGNRGRPYDGGTCYGGEGLPPGVINLNDYFSAGCLHSFDKILDFSRMFIGADHQHFRAGFALWKDPGVLDIYISHTAFGAFNIVGDLAIGSETLRCGIVCRHGGHYDAVFQF